MAGGGGESEKEDDWPVPPSIAGVRLVDAPVLFFVATHKAFRGELAELRRVAEAAAESGECGRELVVDLCRRLEFLKLVYNYHSTAEDEVIFLALDAQVKNVVPTYALEHISIDVYFDFIFHLLDLLMNKDEDAPQMFQELLFSIGTVQTMICQHMQKEEQQVFPLLMEKFTCEEQSQLVWQYMCMVPLILLEDFLPWMTLYLSFEEKLDVLCCIKLVISKDRLLQEVVVSWIQHEEEGSSFDTENIYRKGNLLLNGLTNSKDMHKLYPPQISCGISSTGIPVNGIHLWHAALRTDLKETTQELYHIRSSNSCFSLPSVLVQLKFIADVLIFYSNTLDKVFYPLFNLLDKNSQSPFCALIDERQINGLQRLLFYESQGSAQQDVVEMLCQELESLVSRLEKNLIFLETEVFPSITKNCASELQLWLLYTSLLMMPLGLLRCTVTWFSAHLTEKQSNSILKNMKSGCPAIYKTFTSLLHEWVLKGCSGKTSIERFRQNLEEMFNGRSFYLAEHKRRNTAFYDQMLRKNSGVKVRRIVTIPSTSVSVTGEEHDISYSSVNLHIFFSQTFRKMLPLQNNIAESNSATFPTLESRPMDLILYIHRALIKDLECIVSLSAKLPANVGFLDEFKNHFKLLQEIYQIHSNSEDEILFPALELKGGLQNISHSYCIDHEMETKHFRRISRVLDEISELHDHEGSNESRLQHYRLCLKLHDTCISLHQVLSDHILREEAEIFPLFRGYFSIEEEEKTVGNMLGRTGVEILQEMIPWLMEYLTSDEQHAAMSLWLNIARNTKFAEWLGEWWEGMTRYNASAGKEGARSPSLADDPLEIVSVYLHKEGIQSQKVPHDRATQKESASDDITHSGHGNLDKTTFVNGGQDVCQSQDLSEYPVDKNRSNEVNERCHEEAERHEKERRKLSSQEHPLCMNQEELEATIRRVSRDATLDCQKKSQIIQNLLMSRWILTQKMSHDEASESNHEGVISGQSPSYQDPLKLTFGCNHYKRNCKLITPCCNKLYTCIRCHDDLADHLVDRKTITQMMCMKCLVIQPIGTKCTSESCSGFSMGRYFCRICKLFDDDERQIYHCPYCNLCRVGKGLGIGYFHCMKCNACMSKTLFKHDCREKCLEENCPICHEYIFTSNSPVKALPCGHSMHSSCFKVYTNSHYICPICSKSLGDMQVYFGMLDALLAEEKIPEEYSGQTQVILCNDCAKRGNASFHWMYHKCPYCGSYNTRLL